MQVSAWGGYVFIINLIPLHVFVLIIMGRFSNRIYTAYTTFFVLGLILSMQIPFVGELLSITYFHTNGLNFLFFRFPTRANKRTYGVLGRVCFVKCCSHLTLPPIETKFCWHQVCFHRRSVGCCCRCVLRCCSSYLCRSDRSLEWKVLYAKLT